MSVISKLSGSRSAQVSVPAKLARRKQFRREFPHRKKCRVCGVTFYTEDGRLGVCGTCYGAIQAKSAQIRKIITRVIVEGSREQQEIIVSKVRAQFLRCTFPLCNFCGTKSREDSNPQDWLVRLEEFIEYQLHHTWSQHLSPGRWRRPGQRRTPAELRQDRRVEILLTFPESKQPRGIRELAKIRQAFKKRTALGRLSAS